MSRIVAEKIRGLILFPDPLKQAAPVITVFSIYHPHSKGSEFGGFHTHEVNYRPNRKITVEYLCTYEYAENNQIKHTLPQCSVSLRQTIISVSDFKRKKLNLNRESNLGRPDL